MEISKRDIELYLQDYVATENSSKGWVWGIDNNGASGDGQFGDMAERADGDIFTHQPHSSQQEALEAGLRYLWGNRQDLVDTARNDACEAARYRAQRKGLTK